MQISLTLMHLLLVILSALNFKNAYGNSKKWQFIALCCWSMCLCLDILKIIFN